MDYRVDWMDDNRDLKEYQFETENEAIAFSTGLAIARHYEETEPFHDSTLIRFESFSHREFITAYHKDAYK